MSGIPIIMPNVIRSRRIWMNSLTTTAQSRWMPDPLMRSYPGRIP